jgi:hypothetical protein
MASSLLKREPQNYLCHAWLNEDRVVVATDTGDLLLFEGYELRTVLLSSPADGRSIDSIISYTKGFVCGGDGGVLRLYERADDAREFYKLTKTFHVEGHENARVNNLAISPSEDSLGLTLSNRQMFHLGLSNTDILKAEEMNFELLATEFHMPNDANMVYTTVY